jgi:hypothetical protein
LAMGTRLATIFPAATGCLNTTAASANCA